MTKNEPIPDEVPYEINDLDEGRTIIRFAEICDHRRDRWVPALDKLVETTDQIVCDLSDTDSMASGWFRLLERLTLNAKNSGKRFLVANVSESLRETADVIGVGKRIEFIDTVDEGWEQ